MWIIDERYPTRNLKVPGMTEPIDIPDESAVQVTKHVGELLVSECESIREHTPNNESDNE